MKLFLSLLLILFCLCSSAQSDTSSQGYQGYYYHKKDFSLLLAVNQGRYTFPELGFALNNYGSYRHPYSFDYFLSAEFHPSAELIIAPKIGVWVAGGAAFGLNLLYYTDFNNEAYVFRPEIGIGYEKAKLVYGYNARLSGALGSVNRHQVALVYCLTIKRLSSSEGP